MFKDTKAFSGFSIGDLAKAKRFYGETLGLEVYGGDKMSLLHIRLGSGAEVLVYPKGRAHTPASFTILNFPVDDVEAAVDALVARGIRFEHFEGEIKTDAKRDSALPRERHCLVQGPGRQHPVGGRGEVIRRS